MAQAWTEAQLQQIDETRELAITTRRRDGSLRDWLPIWVVRAGSEVYVRTWYRRTTGWFGHAVRDGRARIRTPGLEADVDVEDVGEGDGDLRTRVDEAYRAKYATGGGDAAGMTSDETAATTLRLRPTRETRA
jgi:hypothetical protein